MASSEFPVAIIGIAVKLPDVQSCDEFWQLMINGKDTVKDFPPERAADIDHVLSPFRNQLVTKDKPFFTGSFFQSVDKFDNSLFQINPREALFIEPEQRIFLETVWELLEDAGYASNIKGTKTGVYVGNTVNKYKYILTENHPSISHGNHSPFISSRVSYTHNLQGPAMMVATGCSSSLLAVHLACQGLLSGDCEMAIAGGITLDLLPVSTKTDIWNQLGITGPNVRCRAFDASAKGIAKGEGCGVVLLKPLNKALAGRDHIYGILEATTANQDGHSNGITAPHPGAQAQLLCQAWKLANITPNRLDYFEAHGTGTELGDPIEISGITTAFKVFGVTYHGGVENKIPIGSVKANIGHLADGGAGVVALIKTLLCMQKNTIPPAVNFSEPNPHINWKAAPVYVNTSPLDWKPHDDNSPRLASVSAFGLLGTNVHAVVKEYIPAADPVQLSVSRGKETVLLALAANTKPSLIAFIAKMAQFFNNSDDRTSTLLKNVCYTLNTGREQSRFKHRVVFYTNTWDRMLHLLKQLVKVLTKESFDEGDMKYVSISRHATGYCVGYKSDTDEATDLSDELNQITSTFLMGKHVSWKGLYAGTNVQKVSSIPTYAFDRVRYWPRVGKPINKELLELEHKLEQPDTSGDCAVKKSSDIMVKVSKIESASSDPAEKILQEALNEALGTNYNWKELADENLFAHGVDSLICTQICVKLQEEMDCSFSMADFHNNPTFTGIKALIKRKVASKSGSNVCCIKTESDLSSAVTSVLKEALNDSLGKNYNWEELEHENLFALGIDSLMYTHMNMKLTDALHLVAPLTVAELHENPSYKGLCEVIKAKLNHPKSVCSVETHDSDSTEIIIESTTKLFPMSFAQRRLWMIQEMATVACAYNATNCLKITGNFHPAAFVMSANTVLSRHGAFYTVFIDSQNGPMQTHNWKLQVCVLESDLQSFGDEAEDKVMMLYDNDYKTPFNLKQGPLVRCKLYHLPKNMYYFTMVIHHIIFDGWSHFIFYNELWDTYMKLSEGKTVSSTLHKPLYVQFTEEEQMNKASFRLKIDNDLIYWKNKLEGSLPLTTLPGDKKRPPVFTHKGRRITRFISHGMIESLQQISRGQNTMFMTLLATVYVLIHHYTGDKDLIIGTPIAGRYRQDAKHVIGCFINTLALRVQLEDSFSFSDILKAVSKVCMEAYDHQMAPFDHLVSLLNLSRDTSITPVFSVNVCYHNTEMRSEHMTPPSEITVERKLLHNDSSKWDLYFDFLQEPDGMRFTLEYYNGVFSDSYAECIVENYLCVLDSVSQHPSITLSELSLTKGVKKKQLSIVYGTTKNLGEVVLPVLLLKRLQLHAKDSFIIDLHGTHIKYSELLAKAMRLAVFLRESCKLPKQSRVGILLENSSEALESILACVFSGLVYVPLDSYRPSSRLKHICNEAEIKLIIFGKSNLALANQLQWASSSLKIVFCVDGENYEELQEDTLKTPLMNIELWDCVASKAKNDIEGGGWKSSYTGEHMSTKEMNEYTENVLKKLKKYLNPESRILEIGCASGLTTRKLCQFVDHYVATDLSQLMTERLEKKLQEEGISNVEVICIPADHVGHTFQDVEFDVIVMNSVVHCFPGHNYLRKVLSACEFILSENGIIFIGDIMDLNLKDKMVASLKSFKNIYPQHRVKTEWHNELFLSRTFIQYLCASSKTLKSVTCSRKFYTIPNELTEFRFDAVFTKSTCSDDISESLNEYKTCAISDVMSAVDCKYDTTTLNKIITGWTDGIELRDEMYILYTSGTTGVPKGVIISHEAILNYVTWAAATYKLDTKALMPLFSPLTFDFTLTAIFPPLISGSTIHIFKNFQESYMAMASCQQITTVKFSPLQLDTILSATEKPLSASTFIIGGEELTSTLLEKLKKNKMNESFVVWNEYGPTEATVGCIVRCFTSEELPLDPTELVSIGQPIDNVTIAVVRDNFKPVPIGGKGTLSVGGKCLCSDFAGNGASKEDNRNRSFSTACWGRPGEQMLLTDDIVEVLPATCELAYFGREKDCNTTKVNGIRVDLMEVQHAIESNHLIHSAWVSSFLYENHTYLGAALKLKPTTQDEQCSGKSWKQLLASSLAQTLPIRFIPKVFVTVSDPPTNVNGKKDVPLLQRLFIAEMYANTAKDYGSKQESSNSNFILMSKLQGIWQSVLPINHLPHPNEDFFFDLSGDSLQAIHLVRKMRDEGFTISVTDIFQNPTIEKLIITLQENSHVSIEPYQSLTEENIKFKPTPILEEYFNGSPLTKCLDRFALSALLCFHTKLEIHTLKKALRAIMMKHVSLHSRFEINSGTVLQQAIELSSDEPKVIEVNITRKYDQLSNEPEFYELCQQLEESHSLSEGILMNAGIINFAERPTSEFASDQMYVLLVVHHAAIDIVSWQQILQDLAVVLRQLSEDQNTEPVLQKCLLPFPSFCEALHAEASTGMFISEIDYWKDIEKQCMESGNLIKGNQQGKFKSAKWFSKSIEASCLRSISQKLGSSNEHILLTAFGRSISSIHGQDKTAICLESHGRQLTSVDSTDTVGWCTSRFPFVLDTPLTEDLITQVKLIDEKVSQIPNHGLGFGSLKSARKLEMSYPKIMFVFQGSLDASTKQTFDGGTFKFDYIPWIEVMLHELKQGRFHRHAEGILEFHLEIIAWIHGGELKFGCLFDKDVISEFLVEDIVKRAHMNLQALAEKLHTKAKEIKVEVISSFIITPDCVQTVKDALWYHNVHANEIKVQPPEQTLQSLYKAEEEVADVTIIIPRHTTRDQAIEFAEVYNQSRKLRKSTKVVIINAETVTNSVKLPAEVLQVNDNIVLLPEFIASSFYDGSSDVEYCMPFTQNGYTHLGLTIARTIRATIFHSKYKVIAVDADYTLWNGECAEGSVSFSQANITLHRFLLKMKNQGVLLIILSKNNGRDIENVFEQQQGDIQLKRNDFIAIAANWERKSDNIRHVSQLLNLGLDTFVFIDDNVLECEEMLHSFPEVLTLQFPSTEEVLVPPLLNSLWLLDTFNATSESARRTEMYRNEFARQEEMKSLATIDSTSHNNELFKLLSRWNLKMTICKTTVALLKQNKTIYERATELLHRTNQFKLNNVNTKLNEVRDEDICWLVFLEDCHGSYGIVSVILLSQKTNGSKVISQWVLSCRALGRKVEHRILYEVHKEAKSLQLAINETGRNTPALKFLRSLDVQCDVCGTDLIHITFEDVHLPEVTEALHEIDSVDLKALQEKLFAVSRIADDHQHNVKMSQPISNVVNSTSLKEVYQWIQRRWSPSQKQQSIRHSMFPIIPACKYLTKHDINIGYHHISSREHGLKVAWMEVLQSNEEPKATDNFFNCGGNSFCAVFLVSKLQRSCKIAINIMDVLQNPKYNDFKNVVLHANTISDETHQEKQSNDNYHPLSAAQQRMVIMQQTAPHSTAYVETIACHTKIGINPAEVFKALVKQHSILTAKIEMDNESESYMMMKNGELDFAMKPEVVENLEAAECYLTKSIPVIEISIDGTSANLVKFRHLKAGNFTVLVVHVHHVIVDAITLSNISHDLQKLMSGATEKTDSCEQSYAVYVDFEERYFKSSQYNADSQFWRDSFTILPSDSNLSILPKVESTWNDTEVYKAKHISQFISTVTTKEIIGFCNALGITDFQYYLACTAVVLQRYLGIDEVTLAIPVTTRTDIHQHTEGLFVNTVVFKVAVDLSMTFKQYIRAVAESWLKTLCHSQYPLDQVTRIVWKEHGKSVNTFCNVMFNYKMQNQSENELRVYSRHAKMPLSLDIIYNSEKKKTELLAEWAAGLIDDNIVNRLADSMVTMYRKAVRNADCKLHDTETLSPHEYELLQSFNSHTAQPHLKTSIPVHKIFEEHAAMNPGAVAVFSSGTFLSYGQLNEMASRIAYGLSQRIGQTVLKSRPVVIVMKKDEYAIASILGIWKAGGHFLPVALSTQSCLKDVLERCTPAAVLSNITLDTIPLMSGNKKCPFLSIEDIIKCSLEGCTWSEATDIETTKDNLAYIIRTSGSTGRPKQCKISHSSLAIIADAWAEKYKMDDFTVNVLQWAPLSFDVFVGDFVRGLICAPGQLTICPDRFRLDVFYILNLIREHKITMAEVTPQFGLQLVENASGRDLESLKLFILGSDMLQYHLYKKVKNLLNKDQRLINSYGMTEATIDSSFFEGNCPRTRSGTVPIGKPLPGVYIHIVDARTLQPCPVGTIGEMYISGPILASGDVEIVELKPLHCWGLKTGDAACWLPSGDIELMGRLDNMVKLRGFRISTTEIENKIVELVRGVKDACVVPLTNDDGLNFLCAFLVLNENTPKGMVSQHTVYNQLKGELSYYMLPDIVHIIDRIPLTAHGKINHKALPNATQLLEIEVGKDDENSSHVSQTVLTLVELFAKALGIPDSSKIHHEVTFMEQGGHSLILVRFASLIKQKTIFKVGIADLFSYPSINALADFIDDKKASKNEDYGFQQTAKELDTEKSKDQDIAITGLGLRLPGGIMSLPQLWEVLDKGNDLIRDFPETRANDVLNCLSSSAAKTLSSSDTFQGAFLEQIDQFDNQFFKIAPGEAKFMSPEQRLFLQVATEALAEGTKLSQVKGAKIGVFVGNSEIGYSQLNHSDEAICVSGLMPGMIATRVAYQWDLKGPTMLIDTACSSSIMALKQACESIKRNECEGALVGGVSLVLYPARTGIFGQTSILSPDFHCKAFDKDANGTAVGEGILCLYVEPLSKALKEEKHIYGILKSIASNSVGHGNGITAPTASSQQKVIQEALNTAEVKPSDITFVECHGTGTMLGDKIELSALGSVFNEAHNVDRLPIGSIKSIFGHLDSAAGLLGLFKVLTSFMTKQIAPTAHFKIPHPELIDSSLYVPSKTLPWDTSARVAGVSSFGLTGTNCHVVVSEFSTSFCEPEDQETGLSFYPLLFSGNTVEQIRKQVSLYKAHIQQSILQTGRNTLPGLCLSVAQRLKELAEVKVGHSRWRMVILAKEAAQVLKVMDIINSTKDADTLKKLASLRSDLLVCCPESKETKCTSPAIQGYLADGRIDLKSLFNGKHCCIKAASEVTIAMYDESRHWLESTSLGRTETYSESLLDLLQNQLGKTREMVRTLPLAPTQDLRETQAKFCAAIIIKFFLHTDMAECIEKSKEITFTKAFSLSNMLAKYEKLFLIMIRELLENGLILPTGSDESIFYLDTFRFRCQNLLNTDPEVIANYAVQKYPSWSDCFRFPLYCSKNLHEVLQGRMSPLSVIYPQGDLNFMNQFDKLGDLLGDVYYNMYMQIIATYARQLSSQGKKVRVLEVGAGVGYVTRQLLPKLKDTPNIEYWFTDLGKAFVEHAKTLFSDYLYMMKFSIFDITKSAPKQGILGSFDIVISYNVIHTTESIKDSVINLKSCLGNDGTLFIIESAKNETWATLAWGILDGWWFFKDYDLRPAEPMMEPEKWERVLTELGFASVYSCPIDEYERSHVEKFLFLCSAKTLTNSNLPRLGWWETDAHRFDPIKQHTELEYEEENVNEKTDLLIDRQRIHLELKKIWSELLGIDNILPEDDFNSLGGESLLAIQMIKLVQKKIGYQLEIADTFGYPTLGALAEFITDRMNEHKSADSVKISGPSVVSSLSCSSAADDNQPTSSNNSKATSVPNTEVARKAPLLTLEQGTLLMFPGQGAQKAGMCISMKDSPEAKSIFARAERILRYNILDICLKNDTNLEERLKSTEFVQVALLVGCIAKLEQLKAERPDLSKKVTHVAGLSVGEFAALVYAGVIKFEDALKLVQVRGKAMEEEVRRSCTGMVSIFGPECEQLEEFLKENFPLMKISTYLADNQHTVAGTEEECNSLVESLSCKHKDQMKVIDVRKLRVAGAFHSTYMKQPAKVINPIIESMEFSQPLISIIMNVSGQTVQDPAEIKALLCEQLVAPVKWKHSVLTAYGANVRNFIEIAPARVLTSIVKKRILECRNCNIEYIVV